MYMLGEVTGEQRVMLSGCVVLQRCVRCLHESYQNFRFHILVFQWRQVYAAAHGCQHISKGSTRKQRRMLWTLSLSSHAMESGLLLYTEDFFFFFSLKNYVGELFSFAKILHPFDSCGVTRCRIDNMIVAHNTHIKIILSL